VKLSSYPFLIRNLYLSLTELAEAAGMDFKIYENGNIREGGCLSYVFAVVSVSSARYRFEISLKEE
jgi:hypothetical protein